MGYIRHHVIIVTSWDKKRIIAAQDKALEIFPKCQVSNLVMGIVNGYYSFFIGPDGSKEGWEESYTGDRNRQLFCDWLKSKQYPDGSTSLNWIEVRSYDEEGFVAIENSCSKKIITHVYQEDV